MNKLNIQELIHLIDELRADSTEREWFEFKETHCSPEEIGEYLSALANSACINDKPEGYLVIGIKDKSHEVVGTDFDPYAAKKSNQALLMWLTMGLSPNLGFQAFRFNYCNKTVVLFQVKTAIDRPVSFYGKEYIRIHNEHKTELKKHPEKAREIWNKKQQVDDWSGEICVSATIEDLDTAAIQKARNEFKTKYTHQIKDVDSWDDITFLNKAKITIHNQITNAAILLLGKAESSALISPVVARISWVLKDDKNNEKDYQHFGPPFLLNVNAVFDKIRNLTIRHLPDGTLFPLETTQYDPWVLREALHNSIAHQDYSLNGRINIVETPTRIIFSNVGSFLPGSIEKIIQQDAPQEIYRNPFLAEAMVHLNMIDTQGGGIKKMFSMQVKRFFPLPDYDISQREKVVVSLRGEIIDERYTKMLISRTDLDLWSAILLDKVQKKVAISKEQCGRLREIGAIEGRFPNIFISASIAKVTGEKAEHIKHRGLNNKYNLDLMLELIKEHGPVSRSEIDRLLLEKLPDILSLNQKKNRIHNYVSKLNRLGKIKNIGSRKKPQWVVVTGE